MKHRNSGKLVYSSEQGSICKLCGLPQKACLCRRNPRAPAGPKGDGIVRDGIVRVGRESKGRRGKTVTTATGVPLGGEALAELAGELKRRCGSGGALKDGVIEIQGDHRDAIVLELEKRGFQVKRAGG